ncbi:unnamed protein product [Echinostoma caproni]|uniref:MFS domain-containing protein n=1 Tax=Echinostoma caproni TaxID=27848 RepID=A0A183B3I6_9TREM|nr:unnamed protein product [Echinostoma caproni]
MQPVEEATTAQNQKRSKCGCTRISWPMYAKTAALVYSWISLGLYSEILGPTLPTLMHQTNSNYEQVGLALSIRSVGLLSGSVIGGMASDQWKLQRGFMVALALIVAALTNAIIPWIRTLGGLATVLFVAGCSHGFHTTSTWSVPRFFLLFVEKWISVPCFYFG